MTARQVWEGMLTELSKANAPSLLLHEFNYYINKAINQYINKRYNIYDINQQTTDDLRVLKTTALLKPYKVTNCAYSNWGLGDKGAGSAKLFGATYEVNLPDDYLHMLNCVCIYKMLKSHKCYNKNDYVDFAARRLTADTWSIIMNDYYNRPLPERPYYYIHNVNTEGNNGEKTYNPIKEDGSGTDMRGIYNVEPSSNTETNILAGNPEKVTDTNNKTNFNRTITFNGSQTTNISTIEKQTAYRYGNTSKVRCEIRYGKDSSVYLLEDVLIDYIKAPQTIRLTKEQVDLTEDTSQIMEFPDYVCQEIINELTMLVMARDADPRFNAQVAVTQSIANPAQAQTPQTQQARQQQA